MKNALLLCFGLALGQMLLAQVEVREDDHFWRRRVVSRLDLKEPINAPLRRHLVPEYSDLHPCTEFSGVVSSLINGLKAKQYLAYDPSDFTTSYDYDQAQGRMQLLQNSLATSQALMIANENKDQLIFPDQPQATTPSAAKHEAKQPKLAYGFQANTSEQAPVWNPQASDKPLFDERLKPYEEALYVIEDWFFDNNRSVAVRNVQYIILVWNDPAGNVREQQVLAFRYADIKPQLEKTLWKRGREQVEKHNLRQVFDSHLFNGIIQNVSGKDMYSMEQSIRALQKMQDYELKLWTVHKLR